MKSTMGVDMTEEVVQAIKEVEQQRPFLVEEWSGSPYQKWAKNFCYRNQWRVQHHIGEYEDCLAECAMAYVEVRIRYGATVKTPQQFMYMYKLWVTSIFNNFSNKDTKNRDFIGSLPTKEQVVQPEAHAVIALNEASPELKSVMNIFINAPQEFMELLRKEADSHCPKQFFNQILIHLGIGKARSGELVKELKGLLS